MATQKLYTIEEASKIVGEYIKKSAARLEARLKKANEEQTKKERRLHRSLLKNEIVNF